MLKDVMITATVLACIGFVAIYLGIGIVFNILVFDKRLKLTHRLYLLVAWPGFVDSHQTIEEKRKARKIEEARQAQMQETRVKRRGF